MELVAEPQQQRLEVRGAAPDGATASTGKPASTSAIGPWRKSAAEYGSARTWASSLSLSAHSRAVAYS